MERKRKYLFENIHNIVQFQIYLPTLYNSLKVAQVFLFKQLFSSLNHPHALDGDFSTFYCNFQVI